MKDSESSERKIDTHIRYNYLDGYVYEHTGPSFRDFAEATAFLNSHTIVRVPPFWDGEEKERALFSDLCTFLLFDIPVITGVIWIDDNATDFIKGQEGWKDWSAHEKMKNAETLEMVTAELKRAYPLHQFALMW